jgi:hypothetical protein
MIVKCLVCWLISQKTKNSYSKNFITISPQELKNLKTHELKNLQFRILKADESVDDGVDGKTC